MQGNKVIFDPIKNQVVIVAVKRSKGRRLFSKVKEMPLCPFCKVNEKMTPPTRLALPNARDWRTRVFENAFPALKPKGRFKKIPGPAFGEHEVVVETPSHDQLF